MVPPGVSLVWANDKALAAHSRADARVGYLDWDQRLETASYYQYFAGTPPIAHVFGLREALLIIEEEGGVEAVWERHRILADAVRAAASAWAAPDGIEFNITDPAHQANCVTTLLTNSIDPVALRAGCADQAGLVLGLGIAGIPGVRIGHMGHLNPPMILGTLGTIEAVLRSMGAPLGGSGVAAAAAVIAAAL